VNAPATEIAPHAPNTTERYAIDAVQAPTVIS
jgi:hypothetical protein